ncbi:MAG: hypothetical protein C4581_12625 [Nitrospiraceae bacterium]|nr:MAG: hypothetical protein C4581_12625 [Nitrospiraceae bacterium]
MKLGIMQPYFYPYLGYFDLINYSDKWVVFDTVQYIRHGWMNRNRIVNPNGGWQYIIAPLKKHSRNTLIKDIEVMDDPGWHSRILGQIQHYRKAPYFTEVYRLMEECLEIRESSLSRLNVAILCNVCRYLDISFKYEFYSEMDLKIGQIEGPADWALRISEAMGAGEYVNPPGARNMFDEAKFQELGMKLTIRELPVFVYECGGFEFVPGLSIIDVLMWNSPEQIKNYLDFHEVESNAVEI